MCFTLVNINHECLNEEMNNKRAIRNVSEKPQVLCNPVIK